MNQVFSAFCHCFGNTLAWQGWAWESFPRTAPEPPASDAPGSRGQGWQRARVLLPLLLVQASRPRCFKNGDVSAPGAVWAWDRWPCRP